MNAEETIRAYYDALRDGDPLVAFFAADESIVKFGIGERLTGHEAIREGLAEQAATTEAWRVDSKQLVVTERDDQAWFSDDVTMAWTDSETGSRWTFESRWSGTLERRPNARRADETPETPWRFVGMHVSAPRRTA
jgi:hypothetical protein